MAIASAALFGTSTPLAKLLLGDGVDPWLLAGLLYLGSGLGLGLIHLARGALRLKLPARLDPFLVFMIATVAPAGSARSRSRPSRNEMTFGVTWNAV
jgi:drug/metabolite transporter (DMT)-like permease